jgi:hypothetical protein
MVQQILVKFGYQRHDSIGEILKAGEFRRVEDIPPWTICSLLPRLWELLIEVSPIRRSALSLKETVSAGVGLVGSVLDTGPPGVPIIDRSSCSGPCVLSSLGELLQ